MSEVTLDRLMFLRSGGAVSRCHLVPMIDRQTNAAHTWGVVTLLLELHPNPNVKLLRAAQYHDVSEAVIGDLPAHAGWMFPRLKAAMCDAADSVNAGNFLGQDLEPSDEAWLNGCDLLELAFTCVDQLRLGNKNFSVILERVLVRFQEIGHHFPKAVLETFDALLHDTLLKGMLSHGSLHQERRTRRDAEGLTTQSVS